MWTTRRLVKLGHALREMEQKHTCEESCMLSCWNRLSENAQLGLLTLPPALTCLASLLLFWVRLMRSPEVPVQQPSLLLRSRACSHQVVKPKYLLCLSLCLKSLYNLYFWLFAFLLQPEIQMGLISCMNSSPVSSTDFWIWPAAVCILHRFSLKTRQIIATKEAIPTFLLETIHGLLCVWIKVAISKSSSKCSNGHRLSPLPCSIILLVHKNIGNCTWLHITCT